MDDNDDATGRFTAAAAYRMMAALLDASHLVTLDDVPALMTGLVGAVGLSDPVLYVVDLRQENLVRLGSAARAPTRLPVDGSLAGRAFCDTRILSQTAMDGGAGDQDDHARRVWVPLLDGTERIGVLGGLTARTDDDLEPHLQALSSLLALVVVSKRPHSDTHARLVRSEPMTVSAEIIRPLMPPLTVATDDLVVCAVLEPAYRLGGDLVDLSMIGGTAHVSIFDAMGHDQSSGLTATLATATCRNQRRHGADLVETSRAIDRAVAAQFDRQRFVTGILADLDRATGVLRWVNRGHPPPLLIRGGRRVSALSCPPSPPMGFELECEPTVCRVHLEPGDRLLCYTDGIVEARDEHGEVFGLRRFTDLVLRREADGHSAPETLRRLMRTVRDHQHGPPRDDATVMLIEWRGERHRRLVF
jgi:hypothetical protein